MEIITDADALRQVSIPVNIDDDNYPNISSLLDSLPKDALGLSAPQIGLFERLFVANLSTGRFIFVNPSLVEKSDGMAASTEMCLSLPGVRRVVSRHMQVVIKADEIYYHTCLKVRLHEKSMTLNFQDAYIIQHEYDHLEGVLIIDLPPHKSDDKKVREKRSNRMLKIISKRESRKNAVKVNMPKKISAKNSEKLKKKEKRQRRKEMKDLQKRVEIEERYEARKIGLLK